MSKFKVGDRVVATKNVDGQDTRGKSGTVKKIAGKCVAVDFDENIGGWGDRFLGIKPGHGWNCHENEVTFLNNQTIVIYPKGRETIALLKEGKKVAKISKAKCHPDDEFDFEIGAKLAFSRLMGDELAVKEVKRVAKLGEYVKVVDHTDEFTLGLIARCIWECDDNIHRFEANGEEYYMLPTRYVVLEGYVPEEKPTVKEVKRPAKVGEWIKIVHANMTEGCYNNGDVLEVVHVDDNVVVYAITKGTHHDNRGENTSAICIDEYVVLENYQPEEPKPFRKAMVGDKIKVIKTAGEHMPNLRLGDVHTVKEVNGDGAWTDKGNFFYDSDQEYIFVEEAPEEIKVGDIVEVVNTGNSYTTYSDWFKENEPDIGLRYAFGQTVPEGTGYKVIAKHPHNKRSKDILYAISKGSSYSSVYLVGERAIKKVK